MRFYFSGPRIGLVRPGVSFNARRERRSAYRPEALGDYVYVIQGEHGHAKIGVSADPGSRLAALQTGSSCPLSIVWCSRVAGDAYAVEQEAHAMLAAHRLAGEWFDINPEGAIGAIYGAAYRLNIPLGEFAPDAPKLRLLGLSLPAWRRLVLFAGFLGLMAVFGKIQFYNLFMLMVFWVIFQKSVLLPRALEWLAMRKIRRQARSSSAS